jgi:hypothetical protein
MTNQPSDNLTVTVEISGGSSTIADILTDQYGHLETGEARTALESYYTDGVWNDEELAEHFEVSHFDEPPYVHVIRKSDGCRGTLMFLSSPRFYFSFNAESGTNVTGPT